MKKYNVVIIGAGPAGLFTAYELVINQFRGNILLIDQGNSFEQRTCSSLTNTCKNCNPCSMVSGIGGAGLFSDGKLCFLDQVGKKLNSPTLTKQSSAELLKYTKQIFDKNNTQIPSDSQQTNNLELKKFFAKAGLSLTTYPVHRLTFSQRINLIQNIINTLLCNGVTVMSNTKALDIQNYNNSKIISISNNNIISYVQAEKVVLATGKIGAKWITHQVYKHKIKNLNNPLYVGVRLELPYKVTQELSKISENPKISYTNRETGDYIKTHCFSNKGQVVITNYDGLKLVDGNYLKELPQKNTSINILMRWNLPSHTIPFYNISRIVKSINEIGKSKPVVQRIGDSKKFQKTNHLKDGNVIPTLKSCESEDLTSLLSYRFYTNFCQFLERIDNFIPGFNHEDNLIYTPVVEWWNNQLVSDSSMQTNVPNLFAVGDGAGISQGIVSAAMSGILAAQHINIIA